MSNEAATVVTMQPLAAWQKIEQGWLCIHSASKDLIAQQLDNDEFNRRFPVLARH